MKKMLTIAMLALAIMVMSVPVAMSAIDSTRSLPEYISEGRHADYLVNDVLNHNGPASTRLQTQNFAAFLNYQCTDSLGGTKFSIMADSMYFPVMYVPTGMSFIIDSLWYFCQVEPEANGKTCRLMVLVYDASAGATDTLVYTKSLDDDSIASVNTPVLLTLNKTTASATLDAGDILWAQISTDSALAVEPKGATLAGKGRKIY